MPVHAPYCAADEFCLCWMESGPRKLRPRRQATVAIVGAGLAGLAAADQLINRYGFHDVRIYEALDRPGGRVHTVPFGGGYVELGAQHIQNLPNSLLLKLAKETGVISSMHQQQSKVLSFLMGAHLTSNKHDVKFRRQNADVSLKEGGVQVEEKLVKDFRQLLLNTETQAAKGKLKLVNFPRNMKRNLGAVQTYEYNEWRLKKKSRFSDDDLKDLDLLFKFSMKAAEYDYGCNDWNDVSLASTSHFYTLCERQTDYKLLTSGWRNGFSALIEKLVSRLPDDCLRLKMVCQSIDWQAPWIQLNFKDGSTVTCEHVLITIPLGHLKRYATILFSPPLPSNKLLSLDGMGFGTVEKLFAKFNKPFWKSNVRRYELLWGEPTDEEPLEMKIARSFFVVEPVLTATNVVCLWITGSSAEEAWKSSESLLKQAVFRLVSRFFLIIDDNDAYPLDILRSNWNGSKFFGGSYSYYGQSYDGHEHGPMQLAEPLYSQEEMDMFWNIHHQTTPTPLVLFAGEATCVHSYGTAHGAMSSGHREARRLHLLYKKHALDKPSQIETTTSDIQIDSSSSCKSPARSKLGGYLKILNKK